MATGVVNMWQADPEALARSYHRIEAKHPGRFLLGVGVGHREATQEYRKPYDKIVSYLDALAAAGVPGSATVLAALGPKVLRLSAERTAGAHPYLTTPEHTRRAREILGDGVLLAPEQKVVLDPIPNGPGGKPVPWSPATSDSPTTPTTSADSVGPMPTSPTVAATRSSTRSPYTVTPTPSCEMSGPTSTREPIACCVQVLPMDVTLSPSYRAIAEAVGLSTAV